MESDQDIERLQAAMLQQAEQQLTNVIAHTNTAFHVKHGWSTAMWLYLLVAYELYAELDTFPEFEVVDGGVA